MLHALNIVKGAVSIKDLVPVLTHVAVHEGRLHAFNGRLHISAPCPELKGYSFTVPLTPFIAAVEVCEGVPKLQHADNILTLSGAGSFSASMPTGQVEAFPLAEPEGKKVKVKNMLGVLKALHPFIGEDASRPWSAAVLFDGTCAYATNNVILVEAEVGGSGMPYLVLPSHAVDEVLRLGMEPQFLSVTPNAVVIHYPFGIWLRTTVVEEKWPDVKAILKGHQEGANAIPIPKSLRKAVEQIRAFCPDPKHPYISFQEERVSTLDGVTRASVGGLEGRGIGKGTYHADPLLKALSVAYSADWGRFPRVPFYGASLASGNSPQIPLSGVLLGLNL
jgi:DNA polymerase III sliding clamp (beta) subunit (PCNA family)